jgi:hypothetical protein
LSVIMIYHENMFYATSMIVDNIQENEIYDFCGSN